MTIYPRRLNRNVFTGPGGSSRPATHTSAYTTVKNTTSMNGLTISAIVQAGIKFCIGDRL